MSELSVSTPIYSGPLDLLLFLVRRAEVDLSSLPIADIADQYIEELEKMDRVDLGFAGEYLVMAAQLLKLKSEMVLHEANADPKDLDPRKSLVKQLLEYKRYRDMSFRLREVLDAESKRFPRPEGLVPDHEPDDVYLDDVEVMDLYRTYSRLMREITPDARHHIALDDRPVEEYIRIILDQLEAGEEVDFSALLEERADRAAVIGNFLALLELVRQQKVEIDQDDAGFRVRTKPESPEADESEQHHGAE